MSPRTGGGQGDKPPIVIHDRRRIDPVTLQPRQPDPDTEEHPGHGTVLGQPDRAAKLEKQLAERTADLQRLKAEYDNYRKRTQRERAQIREATVAEVLAGLVPVLDDLDRAREHGELTGGLQAIANTLISHVTGLGIESFGTPGEPFDPTRHDAVAHQESPDVDRPTCTEIVRPGYRLGQRLLRPAQVTVTAPSLAEDRGAEPSGPALPEPG
ncbi:molecular chaperone GrpE [Streptomyces sp. TLI_235]|nr:nucleotide exchange factor GrpE [Streptomyces sp. TLI_235]PBC69969.1 molecular chaperone GrpE [Streptomyces sp. TLI_235]